MRLNGSITVVALRDNVPEVLNVVVLECLVVGLGVSTNNAVVLCCRDEDEVRHYRRLELALLLE